MSYKVEASVGRSQSMGKVYAMKTSSFKISYPLHLHNISESASEVFT